MRLLKFKFKNIFSLGEGEVNLDNRGLILVTGHSLDEGSSNGSGKSSIANKGILWTLYGQTAGGLKADDVINRHGDAKTGWGLIEFEGFDGHRYTVKRTRPAKLEFYKNDSDVSFRKSSETQKLIDQALGLDFNTFIQTYMFGQGRLSSYASLPPADQKAILEQILPIEQLDVWVEYVKTCLTDLRQAESKTGLDLNILERTLDGRKSDLDKVRNAYETWNEDKEKRISQALAALEVHGEILKDRQLKIKEHEKRLAELAFCKEELKSVNTELEVNNFGAINDLVAKLCSVESRRQEWISNKNLQLSKIIHINEGKCPTCKRSNLDINTIEQIVNDNDEYRNSAKECDAYISQCASLHRKISSDLDVLQEREKALAARRKELETLNIEMIKTEAELNHQLKLGDHTEEFKSRVEYIVSEENPHAEILASYEKDIATTRERIRPLAKLLEKLRNEKEHVNWWLNIYGHDAKMKLFDAVCHFLDSQTEYYLKELKNPQLKVQFSTVKKLASGEVKEDFNVRVYSEKGGEGFETLSGGEQQIVSFAISKALSDLAKAQTSGSSDFEILDEPFSMLDPRNCESLIEFLGKQDGTIMLISNDEHLMNLVPERLHVQKYKGVTSIAYGG